MESLWETIQAHPALLGIGGGTIVILALAWAVVRSSYRYR